MLREGYPDQKPSMSESSENLTAQGIGYPVPATLRSAQAGSWSSISNDRNASEVLNSENPFGRSSVVQRSPPPTSSDRSAEKENEELRRQLNNIEKITSELMNEVKYLKIENEKLKKSLQEKEPEEQDATEVRRKDALQAKKPEERRVVEFHTDEEELREETDWILKQNRKKRSTKKGRRNLPQKLKPQIKLLNQVF